MINGSKKDRKCWHGVVSTQSVYDLVIGFYEHDNETPDSLKDAKYLDRLRHYQLLKKDSTPWSCITNIRLNTEVE
jgi:hypothetical protein